MEALEPFYPERMASRILGAWRCGGAGWHCVVTCVRVCLPLCAQAWRGGRASHRPVHSLPARPMPAHARPRLAGMGDVVSLVEKVEGSIKEEEAAELTRKMMTGEWVGAGAMARGLWCGGRDAGWAPRRGRPPLSLRTPVALLRLLRLLRAHAAVLNPAR